MIKRKKQVDVFSSKHGTLFNDLVLAPGGNFGTYLRWKWRNNAVSVVPTHKGSIGIAKMFRYPIGKYSWEFPRGGKLSYERPETAALRELREETGIIGRKPRIIGTVYADTGLIQNLVTVLQVEMHSQEEHRQGNLEEIVEMQWWTQVKLKNEIRNGRIRCAITIASFSLYLQTLR